MTTIELSDTQAALIIDEGGEVDLILPDVPEDEEAPWNHIAISTLAAVLATEEVFRALVDMVFGEVEDEEANSVV